MNIKVGDYVEIIYMKDEPAYIGRKGKVEYIDSIGQIHGTWGGCALIPKVDKFKVITKDLL